MSKIYKLFCLLVGLSLAGISFLSWGAKPALAATATSVQSNPMFGPWQMPTTIQVQQNALSESFSGEGYNSAFLGWTMANLSSYVLGPIAAANAGSYGGDASGRYYNGGAVGVFGNLIAQMTSQPPAHVADYVADIMNNAGFSTPAYAQGTGFKALEPVLPLWKAFRNIAYAGFVIIFIVIGFMIMLRAKINPQTVISVEAALPQIVITLLLITFSYAIAALIIDLIYLLIYLLVGTFAAFGILENTGSSKSLNILLGEDIFKIAFLHLMPLTKISAATGAAAAVEEIVMGIFKQMPELGTAFAFLSGGLAYFIFAIAILIAVFKLFFQLLMAYVGIIFNVIFAPIMLLFNALPGSQSFTSWLKNILANALVFPVTAVMILITAALINIPDFGIVPGIGYEARLFDDAGASAESTFPFVGAGMTASAFQAIIAIGFLMMMPKIIEIIQKMMGIEGGFAGMAAGALGGIQTGAQIGLAPFRKGAGIGADIYKQEEAWKAQRRAFGLPEVSPYQKPGGVVPTPGEVRRQRLKEAGRRLIGL